MSFQAWGTHDGGSWNVLITGPPSWGFDVPLATALCKNLPAENTQQQLIRPKPTRVAVPTEEEEYRITGTLRADLTAFIFRLILLKMRNVSDKSCRENQKHTIYVHQIFPTNVPFMRRCGKIWQSQTCHR